MSKRVSILIIVIMLSILFAVSIVSLCNQLEFEKEDMLRLLDIKEIDIPSILEDSIGLFFYDQYGSAKRSTKEGVSFDANKPLIIFANYNIDDYLSLEQELALFEKWKNAGYNVGCFRWSTLHSNTVIQAQRKIWSRGEGLRYDYVDDEQELAKDFFKFPMAQIFASYYYDFLKKNSFNGDQIRFEGLSLGAQLMISVSSYLLALAEEDLALREFLPDRITCLNMLIADAASNMSAEWLNDSIDINNGRIQSMTDIFKKINNNGIAIEYVNFIEDGIQVAEYKKLIKQTAYLEYNSSLKNKEVAAILWYNSLLEEDIAIDYAASSYSYQYGLGPKTPTSYIYARTGTEYELYKGEYGLKKQYSINTNVPLIAGFIFEDSNNNGNYDERINSRRSGVEVELYMIKLDNTISLIGRTSVKQNGYYQIPIEPILIMNTAGQEFFIKANLLSNYTISPSQGDKQLYYLSTNGIKNNRQSNNFLIYSKRELKIINIGIQKNDDE